MDENERVLIPVKRKRRRALIKMKADLDLKTFDALLEKLMASYKANTKGVNLRPLLKKLINNK